MHVAALTGDEQMTELLLKNFANVDARDYFAGGITPLGITRLLGYATVTQMMQNRFTLF